jgi:hypothetical protein
MASALRSKYSNTQSRTSSMIVELFLIENTILIFIGMSQDPHPFLRMRILNFQVNNNNQCVNLSNVKTQIELKEKHRLTRDNTESKKNSNLSFFFLLI